MPRVIPVVVCQLANAEHRASKRQYAHVFHQTGRICVARALLRLPEANRLGVLLHEAGHLLAGPRGGEDAANSAAKRASGITVYYKDGHNGEQLEWIRPEDRGKARKFLGL